MSNTAAAKLPHGFWIEGKRHQEAELLPITGEVETCLLEHGGTWSLAQKTTVLLTHCVTRIGPIHEVTERTVGTLTVGDRDALLLQLRSLTFGDRMQCLIQCPNKHCGEKMDLELNAKDLLLAGYKEAQAVYDSTFHNGDASYQVLFHLPTGDEQDSVTPLARQDPVLAATALLKHCVERIARVDLPNESVPNLPSELSDSLSESMAKLDPQAEIQLNTTCPVCSQPFATLFDTADFIFQELANHSQTLYREVHQLAFHYHWSEAEIMAMTASKRRRYLELLAEEISERRPA